MGAFWAGHTTTPFHADACSCHWRGLFLTVAKDSILVVRGRILRHNEGHLSAKSVLVLETLSGGQLES